MSRQVWCSECAKDKQPGTRKVLETSEWGEPAEYERVVKGVTRRPQPEQRYIVVNGIREPLSLVYYDCDSCGKAIFPGQPAATWTVWKDGMEEPSEWENEFLQV